MENRLAGVIMENLMTFLEQLRDVIPQGQVSEYGSRVMLIALAALVLGISLAILGAKLARFSFTLGFIVLGGFAGKYFGEHYGIAPEICAALGALLIGVLGFLMFRVWAAVLAAAVLTAVVLGVFGFNRVLPHVQTYEPAAPSLSAVPAEVNGPAAVPPDYGLSDARERAQQRLLDFWQHVSSEDATVERVGQVLAIATGLLSLIIGLLSIRLALIVSTAIMGTVLVTVGFATLLAQTLPRVYQTGVENPVIMGMGVGALLVTSLIMQTLLTRQPAPENKSEGNAE